MIGVARRVIEEGSEFARSPDLPVAMGALVLFVGGFVEDVYGTSLRAQGYLFLALVVFLDERTALAPGRAPG